MTTATTVPILRALVATALLCVLTAGALAQGVPAASAPAPGAPSGESTAPSPSARIDSIDAWLGELRRAKRSAPQAMLQQWVGLQESMRELAEIAEAASSGPRRDSATAWKARYVAGYGFWTAELFDIAAQMARAVAEETTDRRQRALALRDLAQSLENAGRFGESAAESERLLAASDEPGTTEINNHALRLLKAGRYEECLAYVNRIELTGEVAHTRIFSARALAYRGKYPEAAAELRLACDSGETAACTMLESLNEQSPEKYWSDDREYRLRVWKPYNLIDSSLAATSLPRPAEGVSVAWSRFAPSFWFRQIHMLYPEPGEEDVHARRPPELPNAHIGALVVDGVPFTAFVIDRSIADSAARAGVERYLATVHGPSTWGPAMQERTRAQMLRLGREEEGGTLVVVTHAQWSESWVRRLAPGAPWTVVEKR